MDVICPRCAGLDVHKQTVVACVRIAGDGAPLQEVRSFDTTTSGLLALADWLESFGVEHVAMEATGVYGSRCGMCSKATSSWCWPTPRT